MCTGTFDTDVPESVHLYRVSCVPALSSELIPYNYFKPLAMSQAETSSGILEPPE